MLGGFLVSGLRSDEAPYLVFAGILLLAILGQMILVGKMLRSANPKQI
jgi:hypothetical protein